MGLDTGDDAAVYKLTPDLAMVQTLDFFMPVVDDPYDYGRIAAANALSDVYAMGGRPTLALAIVGVPSKRLSMDVVARILEGGAAACTDAGISIVGGHSIDDEELKFGLSVSGLVHPDRVWRNSTAQPGDWLVLTKPLGIGAMASAVKKQLLNPDAYAALVRTTTFLNRVPAEAGIAAGIHAATDVTGFGLLGHTWKMAHGSGLTAEVWLDRRPVLPAARELIAAGVVPGATGRNLTHYGATTAWDDALNQADRQLVADPQTSGGLLFAVPDAHLDVLVTELTRRGALAAAVIGRFVAPGPVPLVIRARFE